MNKGELYNTLNVVLADKGELSQENADNSRQVIEEITNEGIVMTKNKDGFLPIAPEKINVFGWEFTNPIYGGTGSGTVDASPAVGILEGLENAGFETNKELSDMYVEYRADCLLISINDGQDWTLPEVPVAQYSEEMIENAKEISQELKGKMKTHPNREAQGWVFYDVIETLIFPQKPIIPEKYSQRIAWLQAALVRLREESFVTSFGDWCQNTQ